MSGKVSVAPAELQRFVQAALCSYGTTRVVRWLGIAEVTALRIAAGLPVWARIIDAVRTRIAERPEPPSIDARELASSELREFARAACIAKGRRNSGRVLGHHWTTVLRLAAGVPVDPRIVERAEQRMRSLTEQQRTSNNDGDTGSQP